MKVNKAIIPVAGLGTRMLPATKAIPKEMLPIVDKPIIQFIVEECVLAGFDEIIFITHSSKYSIENHFDVSFELEATLDKRVKRSLLKSVKSISKLNVTIHSVRQGEAKGLGHAILCAKTIIQGEPFAIILPDMLIDGSNRSNNLSLMKKEFERSGNSSILLSQVQKKNLSKYGIVKLDKRKIGKKIKSNGFITKIVEKPKKDNAPSNLFVVGRYIFDNSLLKELELSTPDKNGEIQLTSAIEKFIKKNKDVEGFFLEGKVFDCGEKFGYLKAIFNFGVKDQSIGKEIKKYLKSII